MQFCASFKLRIPPATLAIGTAAATAATIPSASTKRQYMGENRLESQQKKVLK